jgi:hypothetical protein
MGGFLTVLVTHSCFVFSYRELFFNLFEVLPLLGI